MSNCGKMRLLCARCVNAHIMRTKTKVDSQNFALMKEVARGAV